MATPLGPEVFTPMTRALIASPSELLSQERPNGAAGAGKGGKDAPTNFVLTPTGVVYFKMDEEEVEDSERIVRTFHTPQMTAAAGSQAPLDFNARVVGEAVVSLLVYLHAAELARITGNTESWVAGEDDDVVGVWERVSAAASKEAVDKAAVALRLSLDEEFTDVAVAHRCHSDVRRRFYFADPDRFYYGMQQYAKLRFWTLAAAASRRHNPMGGACLRRMDSVFGVDLGLGPSDANDVPSCSAPHRSLYIVSLTVVLAALQRYGRYAHTSVAFANYLNNNLTKQAKGDGLCSANLMRHLAVDHAQGGRGGTSVAAVVAAGAPDHEATAKRIADAPVPLPRPVAVKRGRGRSDAVRPRGAKSSRIE